MQTIMVVDDDANIRAVLKYRFEKENYAVQVAADGLEALAQVGSPGPELIILDLMMPKMNGVEFLTHLKANPTTRGIPVIVLTALGHTPQYERVRELGAVSLVVKPFSPRHLVEEVRRALYGTCSGAERRPAKSQETGPQEDLLQLAES